MSPKNSEEDIGREPDAMRKSYAALKDLTGEEQSRVLDWLVKKLKLGFSVPQVGDQVAVQPQFGGGTTTGTAPLGAQTPKAFLTEKRARNNVERIACLAYYLTKHRNSPQFKTSDLTKLNTEAAQIKIGNPAQAVKDGVRAQYITAAGSGKKQITVRGEALVEAMPNFEKVKQVLMDNPVVKGRPRRKNKKQA